MKQVHLFYDVGHGPLPSSSIEMLARSPSRGGLACLPVDDVEEAVDFYLRFLGFDLVGRSAGPPGAIVARDGSQVLLRPRDASEPPRLGIARGQGSRDAVLVVSDVHATFAELSVRGVAVGSPVLVDALLGPTFSVTDWFGNVLCFCQGRSGVGTLVRRHVGEAALRLSSARFARSAVAELRPHLAAFRRFYASLANKHDIFYMFFTGGLLHWAAKAASYVPDDVNLVLLGSHLSMQERAWVTQHLRRPLHHIDVPTNDWAVWDFLFDTNETSFGWLDIDCIVLNGEIFRELPTLASDASLNCAWSYDSGFGFRVANTYLAFVNAAAIAQLRQRGIPVWARPHDWRGGDRSAQAGKRCFYRVPSARERRIMLQVMPPDARGRPRPPGSHAFFDTLSVYQILARAAGYHTHPIRPLDNPMLGPAEPGRPPVPAPQDMSDELIHVGGISYYHAHFRDPSVRARYLAADYVTLDALVSRLPAAYRDRHRAVGEELRSLGVEPPAAADALREYLAGVGGLSPTAVERALSIPTR